MPSLNVELRTDRGKNESHRLRQAGFIPAVMYSHGVSEVIKVPRKDFINLFKGHIPESVLIDLNITDKKEDASHKVFVKDYQRDPVTGEIVHLDFFKTRLDEKIQTVVSVAIVGTSTGARQGGIQEVVERELQIECLPGDLPEKIEIDVTSLEIGQSIHVKDLKASLSIKFLGDLERVIVTVLAPHKAEPEAVVAPVEGAEAVVEETKEKEGEE